METATELETIKWLLVALLVGVAVIAIAAVVVAIVFYAGFGVLKEQHHGKIFREMAEDYLAKNEIDELIDYVKERLESHPQDVWAHWYMGQARYHSGALPESKHSFERVLELEPSWYSSVDSWLNKVEERLSEGPQLVQ